MKEGARAHLVCNDRTRGGSRIGGDHDATVEDATDNCSSGAGGFGQWDAFGMEGGIAVVV